MLNLIRHRRSGRRVVVALWTLCLGCQMSDVGMTAPLDGTFPLMSINGESLPDTLMELPTRTGQPSGCFMIATSGWLKLDLSRRTFVLTRHLPPADCGTRFGSDTTAMGRYAFQGDSLELVAGNDSVRFPAHVTSNQIVVDDPIVHERYIFAR